MKYKIGDKVKIKSDLKENREYGGCSFVPDMAIYRGRTVTITGCNDFFFGRGPVLYYGIKEDHSRWCWTEDMFEETAEMHKPPLGVKPGWLEATSRIKALTEGIMRFADDTVHLINDDRALKSISAWAEEIKIQAHILETTRDADPVLNECRADKENEATQKKAADLEWICKHTILSNDLNLTKWNKTVITTGYLSDAELKDESEKVFRDFLNNYQGDYPAASFYITSQRMCGIKEG